MVNLVYYKIQDGAKVKCLRPIDKSEFLALRNSQRQMALVKGVREGKTSLKMMLLQMNYSCLPNDDGTLKGATRLANSVGMDIDHVPESHMQMLKEVILQKKDELGLLMLEKSARGSGYHLVFRRRTDLTQEQNLKWASTILGVDYDKGAKDITRVFFSTTASPEDLIYLDDEIFRPTPSPSLYGGENNTIEPTKPVEESSPLPSREGSGVGLYFSNEIAPPPIFFPSAKIWTRYCPATSISVTSQYTVTGVSSPLYSISLRMLYSSRRFS